MDDEERKALRQEVRIIDLTSIDEKQEDKSQQEEQEEKTQQEEQEEKTQQQLDEQEENKISVEEEVCFYSKRQQNIKCRN